jgi:hypothetical protein
MAIASIEDLGTCREGTVAGTPAKTLYSNPYNSLSENRSTIASTGTEKVHSASPYSNNEPV